MLYMKGKKRKLFITSSLEVILQILFIPVSTLTWHLMK